MLEMSTEPKIGTISLDLMFIGSKSEAVYPVLYCDDGIAYRLHIQGNEVSDVPLLSHLEGRRVGIIGVADNLRGHWRLILDEDLEKSVIPQSDAKLANKHNELEVGLPSIDQGICDQEDLLSTDEPGDNFSPDKNGAQ